MELQQRYKKVRFFPFSKTSLTWAGIDFPLHDDDKQKEDEEAMEEEEEEEDEEEEDEEEEDEEEVNVTNKYK